MLAQLIVACVTTDPFSGQNKQEIVSLKEINLICKTSYVV